MVQTFSGREQTTLIEWKASQSLIQGTVIGLDAHELRFQGSARASWPRKEMAINCVQETDVG